jgi:hypothetical protein
MAALKLSNPLLLIVLVKANDSLLHRSSGVLPASFDDVIRPHKHRSQGG